MAEYRVAYLVLFLLSLLSVFLYMRMYTKQHGIHYIVFGIVGCLVCLFYYYCSLANTPDEYRLASQNVYAAMVFLPVIVVRMVCDICKVRDSWARDIPILISAVLLILIITTQRTGLFYREFSVDPVTGELNIVHGPVYYLYLTHIVLSLVAVIVLLVRRRKADISMFCFFCVQVMALILVLTSIIVQVLPYGFDWMPVGIVIADVWMLLLCGRLPLYDISSVICETEEEAGKTGILILDSKMRLLGFNAVTAQRFPDITSCRIDAPLPETLPNYGDLMVMVEDLERAGEEQTLILSAEEGYYSLSLDYLRMNGRICGYQLISTDVTDQQRYIHLIENFKEQLEEEVRVKTEDILNMQDTMLLGIAELVESRDNSTGGHIKRTRKVVEILVEEGFVVDTAEDGSIAVGKMEAAVPGQYDLILMDIQMPIMDGYEATRRIRALSDPAVAGVPIVAMTANAFEEDRQAAFAAGMNEHVAKPIDVKQLKEVMARFL